ncbi:MAG: hypothetical protein ACRD01_00115 [Terriglobales bacterium]
MKCPATVVAIAVIDFVGCGLLVIMSGLIPVVGLVRLPAATGAGTPPEEVMLGMAAVYLLPAAWGILTGIALLRMRLWALASTLVFGIFLLGGGAGLGVVAVRPELPAPAEMAAAVRAFLLVTALCVGLLGLWWVVYCSRRRVRAQFLGRGGWERRPFSISLLGWAAVIGGCCCPLAMLAPHPAATFLGWSVAAGTARVVYGVLAVIEFAVGLGLLRLRPWARGTGLALFALWILNSIVLWVFPKAIQHTLDAAVASNPAAAAAANVPDMLFGIMLLSTVGGAVTGLFCLYFLWTRRPAFYPPATPMADATTG